jgi:hypothetical protein
MVHQSSKYMKSRRQAVWMPQSALVCDVRKI